MILQLNDNTYAIQLEKIATDFKIIYDTINKCNRLKYKINDLYRIINLDTIIGECEINCRIYIQGVESDNPILKSFYNTPIVIPEVFGNSNGIVDLLREKGCSLTDREIYLIIRKK